jgi:lysophospholipase L1-like esterase
MAFGVVALVLAAVEVLPDAHLLWKRVLRVIDPDGGKPNERALADTYGGADWTKAYWRESARNQQVDWAPAVLWRTRPASGRFVNVDEHHHRVTPMPPQPGGRPFRIFLFGGSTMFGMGARDEHTIPARLAARLSGGRPIEVVNFGQPGWVMAQSVAELSEQLKVGNVPDLAVFYDGANDVFSTMAQNRAGLPQNNDNREREFNLTNESHRGALYREAVLAALGRTTGLLRKLQPARAEVPDYDRANSEALSAANADYMAGNARQVRALALAYGFRPVFALQPVIFDKTTLTPFEIVARDAYMFVTAQFADAYAAIRRHPDLAGNKDFHDLSDTFANRPEPYFVDFCHLGESGNDAIADRLAAILRPMLEHAPVSR